MHYAVGRERSKRTLPWLILPASTARLRDTLTSPTLRLLAAGAVLPNLISLLTLPFGISIPPRPGSIFLLMAVALCARTLRYGPVVVLFLMALAYDLISTISMQFNLAPFHFIVAIRHATTVNVFASPVYVGLAVVITAQTVGALWLLADRDDCTAQRYGSYSPARPCWPSSTTPAISRRITISVLCSPATSRSIRRWALPASAMLLAATSATP